MSLEDLLGRLIPNYNLYQKDRSQADFYESGAKAYNKEFDKYTSAYDVYEAQANAWQKEADAYNAAVDAYNKARTATPYEQFSGYVPSPGEFNITAPVAPKEPKFTQEEVEAFMKDAQGRAKRRGDAASIAKAVMGRPSEGVGGTQPVITTATDAGLNIAGLSVTPLAQGGAVTPDMGIGGLLKRYAEGGAVQDPIVDLRQRVIATYGFDPAAVAMDEGVDPELFLRMMFQESSGRANAVSQKGAQGLMQLMPDTAEMLGVDPTDPEQNARGGARYLRMMLDEFGTIPLALAAYNAGPGNVRKYQGVPPFEETRNYIANITGVDTGQILPEMGNYYDMRGARGPVERPRMRPEGLGTEDYVSPEPMMSEYLMQGYLPRSAERLPASIPNISLPQTPLEQAAMQQAMEQQAMEQQAMEQEQGPQMQPFTMFNDTMPR